MDGGLNNSSSLTRLGDLVANAATAVGKVHKLAHHPSPKSAHASPKSLNASHSLGSSHHSHSYLSPKNLHDKNHDVNLNMKAYSALTGVKGFVKTSPRVQKKDSMEDSNTTNMGKFDKLTHPENEIPPLDKRIKTALASLHKGEGDIPKTHDQLYSLLQRNIFSQNYIGLTGSGGEIVSPNLWAAFLLMRYTEFWYATFGKPRPKLEDQQFESQLVKDIMEAEDKGPPSTEEENEKKKDEDETGEEADAKKEEDGKGNVQSSLGVFSMASGLKAKTAKTIC